MESQLPAVRWLTPGHLLACQVAHDSVIFHDLNQANNRILLCPGATYNAQSVEAYYDALDKLMEYWPGILGEDAPKIGEGGSQAL